MKISIPPFHIGQKVVCVISHSWGFVVKDKIYTIESIEKCNCGFNVKLVGVTYITGTRCSICNHHHSDVYIKYNRFKPLQEQKVPLITFEKIQEKEKEEILVMN